jgi:ferrochelatase
VSDPNIRWSVIDRWGTNPLFVKAVTRKIEEALNKFDPADREKVVLLFSAHSIPIYVVDRGDPYPQEVSATVQAVMHELNHQNPYRLIWQSKVGPLPWLGPQVEQALTGLAQKGNKHVLLVPIAFTSDHIETLYELDIQYREVADKLGVVMHRSESLNTDPMFIDAMADIVQKHLTSGKISSTQFKLRCPGCENEHCGESKQFFSEQPVASQTASQ